MLTKRSEGRCVRSFGMMRKLTAVRLLFSRRRYGDEIFCGVR
ncbi:hypothetical protein [Ruminococcus albus]|uniref:Uncharacterized protein n=1 Tax=Ruminococcus albus 8 TaxID=246199 RepID=E9S8P9_RUMAL|nr:hypothetical protein [Ruminococcus albus]EGC04334.1 hypothetical protein CUS_5165 [Ruminococcus albus 8]